MRKAPPFLHSDGRDVKQFPAANTTILSGIHPGARYSWQFRIGCGEYSVRDGLTFAWRSPTITTETHQHDQSISENLDRTRDVVRQDLVLIRIIMYRDKYRVMEGTDVVVPLTGYPKVS